MMKDHRVSKAIVCVFMLDLQLGRPPGIFFISPPLDVVSTFSSFFFFFFFFSSLCANSVDSFRHELRLWCSTAGLLVFFFSFFFFEATLTDERGYPHHDAHRPYAPESLLLFLFEAAIMGYL